MLVSRRPRIKKLAVHKLWIKVINVTNLENGYLNLDRTERYISTEEFQRMYKHFEIDDKDIVVASSGNSYAKVAVVRKKDLPLVMNTSVIRFKPLNNLDYGYLLTFLKSDYFKSQIDLLITGGAQPNFGPVHLKKINIIIPSSKQEQFAISVTLYDVDMVIEKLEDLIEKKKHIKQGAMQELLTGKRRLSGFNKRWEDKKISDVCGKITTGKLNANAMVEGGDYRFYTCAKDYYQINNYAFDTEALLVSGNGANVGYIHYYKGKFNAYQRTYVLSDFSADIQYIKLFMDRNLQERIRVEVNAGNTPYITMGTLAEMKIIIPPTKEEQTAIANVLSDMDSEIKKLESQLIKYQNMKQGMMQTLLTGKIRFIK